MARQPRRFELVWRGQAFFAELTLGGSHAYPVSSATISAWRGRTSRGRSSSSSDVFPTRPPAVPTYLLLDGLTDSTVPRADLTGRRRCREDCFGNARRAVIRSRSQRGLCF